MSQILILSICDKKKRSFLDPPPPPTIWKLELFFAIFQHKLKTLTQQLIRFVTKRKTVFAQKVIMIRKKAGKSSKIRGQSALLRRPSHVTNGRYTTTKIADFITKLFTCTMKFVHRDQNKKVGKREQSPWCGQFWCNKWQKWCCHLQQLQHISECGFSLTVLPQNTTECVQ